MKRLILTTDRSGAGGLGAAGLADFVITLERRLVLGPLPAEAEREAFLAARKAQEQGLHWQDYTTAWRLERSGGKDLGLSVFCARYDEIELWIDPDPNAQLNLIWLLDFLRAHEPLPATTKLVQADFSIGDRKPRELAQWRPTPISITTDHLDLASAAWQAYRAPTPQAWFNLLEMDLSPLPRLRPTIVALLGELPWLTTGLGATEMRMLELISNGNISPPDVFVGLIQREPRGAFHYWEIGELLDGLAHCPVPAIDGLDEGPFTMELQDDRERRHRYNRSKLSLTALGKAVRDGKEDFRRHNRIHRWWGGTELTKR